MQKAYIRTLYQIMKTDSRVVSLLSDSGTDYDIIMASEIPTQCFNFGIAEQNQLAIAAGMALCGKIPFVYTSGAFLVYRGYEFIRNDICYQKQNVKIVGMGSGTSWSTLGPSHHTTEDFAALRVLPNLTIFSPATPIEAEACVKWAYEINGPVYIRLGMSGESEFFQNADDLMPNTYPVIKKGEDLLILVSGSILREAVDAALLLEEKGISSTILDIHTIKPLNEQLLLEEASKKKRICTIEEHNIVGGLGGAIAEIIATYNLGVKFKRLGLNDSFAKGYGTQKEVREQNKMDAQSIAKSLMEWMK